MSAPFIFIATNSLREGKLAAERGRAADLGSFIKANEPQLLAFNEYVNEDGTEVGVVQINPNAASMEFHMDVLAERAVGAYAETARGDNQHPGLRRAEPRRVGDARRQSRRRCPDDRQARARRRLYPTPAQPETKAVASETPENSRGLRRMWREGAWRDQGPGAGREYCFRATTRLPPFRAADSQCAESG